MRFSESPPAVHRCRTEPPPSPRCRSRPGVRRTAPGSTKVRKSSFSWESLQFNFLRKTKRARASSAHTRSDLHADADAPASAWEAGCGRPVLGPSQPGTQAPSQSGSCHLCERGARELPLSPHSLNLGQYSTLYRKKQEWKFSPGRPRAARRKEHLSGIGWARREPRWRGMAPAVRTAWPASRPQ